VLFALANLGRHLNIDPESALRGTNAKFRKRFSYIEQHIGSKGQTMESADLDMLESLWQDAKSEA
jgi:ATP diphosphatase